MRKDIKTGAVNYARRVVYSSALTPMSKYVRGKLLGIFPDLAIEREIIQKGRL
jgi:hypothetical protein